ncbi:MAG: S8 family serine peptidase [Acidobacteriaceae bacterium]|nr:S8 family serine peptidase [Acidobacteriaceae bacterium]
MTFKSRTTLPGSENVHRPGLQPSGTVKLDETVRVSVILRRKEDIHPAVPTGDAGHSPLSHEEHENRHGADPSDIAVVEQFAHEAGLTVVEASALKRRVMLTGTAEQMQAAFGAELVCYKAEATGRTYRGRTGTLSIPTVLKNIVLSVLGLDTRPVAEPHFRQRPAAVATGSFTPSQVAALYSFPTGVTGKGQTIAIIELGGGYQSGDLNAYFQGLGLTTPSITAISVDGGKNTPGSAADGEVLLDIEIAGAIANGASIAVYFAPNTDQGFVDAITDAVHDTKRNPSVISISWGGPEDNWSVQARNAMNSALQDAATLGVTVTVAAGDDGSTDGVGDGKLHVDFPASSPFALACGGTTLKGSGSTITSETVWNEIANQQGATGGGVSNFFPLPSYQSSAGVPKQGQTNFAGRGVPDVAGNADPLTGYQVRVDGQDTVVGGTSAVAPLWAALVALMNQQLGKSVGFLNPKLYSSSASTFQDITEGTNDDSNLGHYQAQTGWDPCTGLGSPNGTALLSSLSPSTTGAATQRAPLPGSDPQHSSSAQWTDVADPGQKQLTATIILRRSGEDPGDALLAGAEPALTHGEAATATAASPEDIQKVVSFAEQHGLTVTEANLTARTVKVKGTADQMNNAFGVKLGFVSEAGQGNKYLSHKESISMPHSLSNLVTAVLGLDQRPIAKHHV